MKVLDKIKDVITNKENIAKSIDLASDLIPYKMAVDGAVRLATGHSIKEHIVGDDKVKLEELQIKAKTDPREVVDTIRDIKDNFFQSSLRFDFMLLETECLLKIYSVDHDEDDLIDARNSAIQAMSSNSNKIKSHAKKLLKTIDKEYNLKNIILQSSGAKRQFVMIVPDIEGFYDKTKKITWFLTDDEIPDEFEFSNGGIFRYGQLYVQHPFLDYKYELMDDVPDVFLEERIQELIRLLAALGAVEIQITSENESSLLDKFINNISSSLGGGNGAKSGEANINEQYKTESYTNSQNQKEFRIKCNPHKYPFCPNDRIWYLNNRKFSNFVKTRLESNNLEYIEEITSSNSSNISSEIATDLNITMKELQNSVKFAIHYDQSKMTENKFNNKWKVLAHFKPLEEFDR